MNSFPVLEHMKPDECVGCELCANVCPFKAIEMKPDREGFLLPTFLEGKCVNCGKCAKNCPVLNTLKVDSTDFAKCYYAGYATDDSLVNRSSSGGFWTLLVDKFFQENKTGSFFASVWDKDFKGVHYDYADTIDDIERFRRSKYAQSKKGNVYTKVKEILEDGRAVLFTGTPCEVFALKQYLRKEYELLFTIDLVCQGPTSPKAFEQFLGQLERRYHSKIKDISLREVGGKQWIPQWIRIQFENGRTFFRPFYDTELGEALHTMQRRSCYKCKFTGRNHVSDITIGDYHGADPSAIYYNRCGTSIAVANTERGNQWFGGAVKEKAIVVRTTLEELRETNSRLVGTWNESPKRKKFSEIFCASDIYAAAHAVWSRKQNLLFRVPWGVRRILEKLIRGGR